MRFSCMDVAEAARLRAGKKQGSEQTYICPGHDDRDPSLKINVEKDCWMCGPCGESGNPWQLAAFIGNCRPDDKRRVVDWLRSVNLLEGGESEHPTERISTSLVESLHANLKAKERRYLKDRRCLSEQVICKYKLGLSEDGKWFMIPIFDSSGQCVDIRRWRPPEKRTAGEPKILHFKKGTGGARLFPVDQLQNEQLLVVEGEMDALAALSAGIPSITLTAGAYTWPDELSDLFRGKSATILMDHDRAGQNGSEKRAQSLSRVGVQVQVGSWPADRAKGWDVSDELTENGSESLRSIINEARPFRSASSPREICLADVEAERVEFLWEPYIPFGKVTLVEGDPGVGKSWFSGAVATGISLGRGLPGTDSSSPGVCLLLSAEDGLADTIRPRLESMEANLSQIYAIDGPLTLDQSGTEFLEDKIRARRPSFVVIDPLVAYMGGGVDLHRANEMRVFMGQLSELAKIYGCAIVGVRHLTKGNRSQAIYRGLGSIDIIASVRSALLIGYHPDEKGTRVVVHTKSNLAPLGDSLTYEISEGRFFWTGTTDLTAEEILSVQPDTVRDRAKEFLRETLSKDPVEATAIKEQAKKIGISDRSLERAKKELGIESVREGVAGKQGGGVWWWRLSDGGLDCQGLPLARIGNVKPGNDRDASKLINSGNTLRGLDKSNAGRLPDGEEKKHGNQNAEGFSF